MRRVLYLPAAADRPARAARLWERPFDVALQYLARLRRTRSPLSRGPVELGLLEALEHAGCPVCRVTLGTDERHIFWFLNENLSKIGIPDDLARARGFCSGHGEDLLRQDGGRMRIASTHRILVQRLRARRRPEVLRPVSRAPCSACGATARAGREAAAALARLLDQPKVAERYGAGGHLCLPHLQLVAPALRQATLELVLRAREEAPQIAADRDLGPAVISPPEAGAPPPRLADPVRTLERDLRDGLACPICLEMRRAWLEWAGWLEAGAAKGEAPEDLLPACPTHVRALLRASGPTLAGAIAARALELDRESVRLALSTLHETGREQPERPFLERAALLLQGGAPSTAAAVGALARPVACPLCRRLEAARDRSLALLLALLEQPAHRAAFESGYGLCIGHMARALALGPPHRLCACLAEVEAARLALLDWELAEYARKSAWQARAEPRGTEMSVPARALRRFSGFLCTDLSRPRRPDA